MYDAKFSEKGKLYEIEKSDKFSCNFGLNEQGKAIIHRIEWVKTKGGVDFPQSDITPGDRILCKFFT